MRNDQIFFDEHKTIGRGGFQLVEILAKNFQGFLQKLMDRIAFVHLEIASMTTSVPIAECDIDRFIFHAFLIGHPLLTQLFSQSKEQRKSGLPETQEESNLLILFLFSLLIRQETRVDCRIFAQLLLFEQWRCVGRRRR